MFFFLVKLYNRVFQQAVKIGDKTARRWLKLDHFQSAFKSAQRQLFDQALTGLMQKVDKAIETLDRNMDGEEVPPSTQVRAAQIVLEQSIGIYKVGELEQEIEELKQALGLKEFEES